MRAGEKSMQQGSSQEDWKEKPRRENAGGGSYPHSPKRLFLGLFLLFTLLLLFMLGFLVYYFRSPEALIFHYAFVIIIAGVGILAGASLLALALGSFSLLRGAPPPGLNRLVKKTIVFLFPMVVQLGKMLHIDQEKIQGSFIEVNNKLLEVKQPTVSPDKLLLLLPHCLQEEHCPHKITLDPYHCQRCGKCPVDGLLTMAENWGIKVRVVTGGTLARQTVKSLRPRLVLAVACERDLSSGIADSYPMPVWGILNERPLGPCRNTLVSMEQLESKLAELVKG